MPTLSGTLALARCPHCSVARPQLSLQWQTRTNNSTSNNQRDWVVYLCTTCGGLVTAWSHSVGQKSQDHFPRAASVSVEIPERPRTFLAQAQESLHAPAGAVMLAASAVDSMLKQRGLSEGSLYARIERAAEQHLITSEMTKWAHAVRLDANDQRHADEAASLPNEADAQRSIDFAAALAEILFVLPARVERGLHTGS
jgi:hypothetical protein